MMHCSTSSEAAQVLLAALGADLAEDVAVQLAQRARRHAQAPVHVLSVALLRSLIEAT